MMPYLGSDFGNAHSQHEWGRAAARAVEHARERIALAIGCEDASQIIFTSGATESNNWVLSQFRPGAISPFEHDSVREPAAAEGYQILSFSDGNFESPAEECELVSIIGASNETGIRYSAQSLARKGLKVHSDITQIATKYSFDLGEIDFASFSAHKFYGPKGVGCIYMQQPSLSSFHLGGHQECGLRAGTLNVPGIVGTGLAAQIAYEERDQFNKKICGLRSQFIESISMARDVQINESTNQLPNIISLSVAGIEGESLVFEADRRGFAISSGAACSSGSTEPSPVLKAMGLSEELNRGSVRISMGRTNTAKAVKDLAQTLKASIEQLRNLRS